MSALDEKLKKLREQEKQIEREKKKIEFLRHIEKSVVDYNLKDFAEVKDEVVKLIQTFVESTIKTIEHGSEEVPPVLADKTNQPVPPSQNPKTETKSESEIGPNEKMNFALENRHLGGKDVAIEREGKDAIRGKVVGLDAPYVLVRTDAGPTIKVPIQEVKLV